MFAWLVSFQVKSGKLDEAIKMCKEMDFLELKSVKGYKGSYILCDRKKEEGISMTLWNSEEDAIAIEKNGLLQYQIDRHKDLLTGELVRRGYEVSAKD